MEDKQRLILMAGAILLSNIFGLLSVRGPMEISFSLTALPIFLLSVTLGWETGYVVGVFGGVAQAINYGSPLYIFCTAVLGGVSGYFAKNRGFNRKWSGIFFSIGVFFMFAWIMFVNENYLASEVFAILLALLVFVVLEYHLVRRRVEHSRLMSLTLAACAGSTAYIPFDMAIMGAVQGYGMVQALVVLAKDLVQDYVAAILAVVLLQSKTVRKYLAVK